MIEWVRDIRRSVRQVVLSALLAAPRLVPTGIIIVSLTTAGALIIHEVAAANERQTYIREENNLRLESALEHVEEYFDAVYSALLFVSLDDDVQQMLPNTKQFIQRLFDHQWEEHRLSELYIVEKEFTGTNRPFITFERGSEKHTREETHTIEREMEEYEQHKQHLQQFAADPNLQALISPEVWLCTDTPEGNRARGFIYSVPIRAEDDLKGLVAGMIPTHILQGVLARGEVLGRALLVNDRGEIYAAPRANADVRSWFKSSFAAETPARFFQTRPQTFDVNRWSAMSRPARIVAAGDWWLVYLFDRQGHLANGQFTGVAGASVLVLALLLTGGALALLSHAMATRFQEQLSHLEERRNLERQVQQASEREQRRVGEQLQQDLCQRLEGIRAASQALRARLGKRAAEADLAGEIADELRESLRQAQQMADELQPVTLLEEGFVAAVQKLVVTTEQRSGIACAFFAEAAPPVADRDVATHLYRIAQEALANAVRHSGATRIVVSVSSVENGLCLSVRDNGRGLGRSASVRSGMGMRIMRYRADLIGGDFRVQSGAGQGTELRCYVELRDCEPGVRNLAS